MAGAAESKWRWEETGGLTKRLTCEPGEDQESRELWGTAGWPVGAQSPGPPWLDAGLRLSTPWPSCWRDFLFTKPCAAGRNTERAGSPDGGTKFIPHTLLQILMNYWPVASLTLAFHNAQKPSSQNTDSRLPTWERCRDEERTPQSQPAWVQYLLWYLLPNPR